MIFMTIIFDMRTTVEARPRIPRSAAPGSRTVTALWRPEESVGYRLRLAHHAWTRQLDAVLRPLGVTHLQFIALDAIEIFCERGETPSQVRIAAFMQFDAMMISKILRLLEERGYVERRQHPEDPRANALQLTPAGRELLQAASPVVRAAHAAFFDCRLDADGKKMLAALLDRLLAPATATI
jgi:MarR family transcriptional regulator, organic hydroperoxide resistance regulator